MSQEPTNQPSASGSSAGSSAGMGQFASGAGSKYHDESKILAAVKLFTTLNDDKGGKSGSDESIGSVIGTGGREGAASSEGISRNAFMKIERKILEKLFEINHVLLANQAISPIIYHIVLLLASLQIIFNIFYSVSITNEFSGDHVSSITNANGTVITQSQQSVIRIDQYLAFSNFPYYVINGGTLNSFIMLYAVLAGTFIGFIIILILISGRIFQESKLEDSKDSTKIIVMVLSIIMSLYIFFLQIPFTSVLLQGFICNETFSTGLATASATCGSLENQLLIIFSAVLLLAYYSFLLAETLLFSSTSFEVPVPWGAVEHQLATVKILINLVLSIGYIFDKTGAYGGQINLICSALQAFVVYRRNKTAIIYNNSVYYATIFYETFIFWLYIVVGLHVIADSKLSVMSLLLTMSCGAGIAVCLILHQIRRKSQMILEDHTIAYSEPIEYIVYFYRLHRLIANPDPTTEVFMQGKLRDHIHYCENPKCFCVSVLEFFDVKEGQMKILNQFKEEEQLLFAKENNNTAYQGTVSVIDPGLNMTDIVGPPAENEADTTAEGNNSQLLVPGTSMKGAKAADLKTQSSRLQRMFLQEQDQEEKKDVNAAVSLLAQKRKRQQLEDNINRIMEAQLQAEENQYNWYVLFSIFLKDGIDKYPKNVDLKLINAFVQKTKLANEFKAIFEMMNCELCNPTYHEQFEIFRQKIEIEQALVRAQQRNIQKIGVVDVVQAFNYERLFQRYQFYEYLTTYSALCFWRELLQKQINASVLQEKGQQISKFYEIIQEVAAKLQAIYPNEIKFFFRYGNFLYQIIHNEYDALECYRKAQTIFQMKMNKKVNSMPINEQSFFGENSAAAIIIIQATSSEIGTIIHCNEEVEEVLNYKRKELIGANISSITPRPIAKVHDRLIQRYFETAKPRVIENQRQLLGVTKEGYLQEVDLIVKVFPKVDERIVFVGFVQRAPDFADMEPPSSEYERLDRHYLVTDIDGNITNVTEGLLGELGLHAKFFNYTDSIFQQMFNFKSICPIIMDNSIQESLENEGKIITIDTTGILSNIELETLTSDEIVEVKSNLGRYDAYVQLKRLEITGYVTINIYRIIMSGKFATTTDPNLHNSHNKAQGFLGDSEAYDENSDTVGVGSALMSAAGQPSLSGSMSSATSTSFSFNKVIKDFKKALGERKTPKNLTLLNRIMIGILLATLAISSVNFSTQRNESNQIQSQNEQNLKLESRELKIVQLSSNFISLINIANGLEFDRYDTAFPLLPFDRFEYLSDQIQLQAGDLEIIHEYLTQQRSGMTSQSEPSSSQSSYEYQPVDLFRLTDENIVDNYQQPFRVAFLQFLDYIQSLNNTDRSQLKLPFSLISQAPYLNADNITLNQNTTQIQKAAYFIMTNGLRSLRTMSQNASETYHQVFQTSESKQSVIIIMILGLLISTVSFGVVLYQVWMIDRNKAEILSLYALLQMKEISEVYDACTSYMDILNQGSIVSQVFKQTSDDTDDHEATLAEQMQGLVKQGKNINQINIDGAIALTGNDRKKWSQMSEDEKEEIEQKMLLQLRKKHRRKSMKIKFGAGSDIYSQMVKETFVTMRSIVNKEDATTAKKALSKARSMAKKLASSQNSGKAGKKMQGMQPTQNTKKLQKKPSLEQKKKGGKKRQVVIEAVEEEQHENKSSTQSHGSESDSDEESREKKKKDEKEAKAEAQKNMADISNQELEERKTYFFRTIKSKNWGKLIMNLIVAAIFIAYFIQIYIYDISFKSQMGYLQDSIPLMLNRFRDTMQSYAFLRQRIIYNGSLDSYETQLNYDHDLDKYYNDMSMENEREITKTKTSYQSIIDPLVQVLLSTDSYQFCSDVIQSSNITNFTYQMPTNPWINATKLYATQIASNTALQLAGIAGNVTTLQALKARGVSLNLGNYDQKTALHFASEFGQLAAVQYLAQAGANINAKDRWGATPLTYSMLNPNVTKYLVSLNASQGTDQGDFSALLSVYSGSKLNSSDYISFYAAASNDVAALQSLKTSGLLRIDVTDLEGRTALHVAASQGSLEAFQYLVANGADVSLRDSRNNDCLANAVAAGSQTVIDYIKQVTAYSVIVNNCANFAQGLLQQGLQQAVGNFQKRFADLRIRVQTTPNYAGKLSYLAPPLTNMTPSMPTSATQDSSMLMFLATQELYYDIVIEKLISVIQNTYTTYIASYAQNTEVLFLVFLAFQIVILLILRGKLIHTMKEDIFQSRGILNLIPDTFFEQNRDKVEKLIKKLKD